MKNSNTTTCLECDNKISGYMIYCTIIEQPYEKVHFCSHTCMMEHLIHKLKEELIAGNVQPRHKLIDKVFTYIGMLFTLSKNEFLEEELIDIEEKLSI